MLDIQFDPVGCIECGIGPVVYTDFLLLEIKTQHKAGIFHRETEIKHPCKRCAVKTYQLVVPDQSSVNPVITSHSAYIDNRLLKHIQGEVWLVLCMSTG